MHFLYLLLFVISHICALDHHEIAVAFTEHILSGMNYLSKEVQYQTIEVVSIISFHLVFDKSARVKTKIDRQSRARPVLCRGGQSASAVRFHRCFKKCG